MYLPLPCIWSFRHSPTYLSPLASSILPTPSLDSGGGAEIGIKGSDANACPPIREREGGGGGRARAPRLGQGHAGAGCVCAHRLPLTKSPSYLRPSFHTMRPCGTAGARRVRQSARWRTRAAARGAPAQLRTHACHPRQPGHAAARRATGPCTWASRLRRPSSRRAGCCRPLCAHPAQRRPRMPRRSADRRVPVPDG